ncbi:MAG TPA: hypothetical protein VF244_11270 [Acidimicrobiales bacterium]
MSRHALARRVASVGGAVATAAAMLFVVLGGTAASAGISLQAIVCPILLALRAGFGSFFGLGAVFDALLAAFGCTVPSA